MTWPDLSKLEFAALKRLWLDAVMSDRAVSPRGFMCAYLIADYMNRRTGLAWPSIETLRERLGGVGERTVQDALGRLAGRGWIVRSFRLGRSTHYSLDPDLVEALLADVAARTNPRTPAETCVGDDDGAESCGEDVRKGSATGAETRGGGARASAPITTHGSAEGSAEGSGDAPPPSRPADDWQRIYEELRDAAGYRQGSPRWRYELHRAYDSWRSCPTHEVTHEAILKALPEAPIVDDPADLYDWMIGATGRADDEIPF